MLKIFKSEDPIKINIERIIKLVCDYTAVVIIIDTSNNNSNYDFSKYINEEQYENMCRYKKKNDRLNYAITKSLVNLIFSKINKYKWKNIKWENGENGKPYIKNIIGIHFNISHTQGYSTVALSRSNIGIDIENLERNIEYTEIKQCFFSDNENVNNLKDFYKHWVSKESYLKYKGIGLIQELDSVQVINIQENNVMIVDKKDNLKKQIKLFEEEKYILAVCC